MDWRRQTSINFPDSVACHPRTARYDWRPAGQVSRKSFRWTSPNHVPLP
jgi:hypothetical protein